jgi:PAS domain S-box-containing protein
LRVASVAGDTDGVPPLTSGPRSLSVDDVDDDVDDDVSDDGEMFGGSEQRLSFILNAIPACLSFVDAEGRYVWVNEFYRRRFGLDPKAIAGRHIREIVGAEGWAAVRPHVERALAGEEAIFETQLIDRAGGVTQISAAYVPQRDRRGRVRGFVAMVTDVSERKRSEQALRHTERMLEESQTAARVGSWERTLAAGHPDGDGPLWWSKENYRIFGHDPATVVIDYPTFLASVHPDDRAAMQAVAAAGVENGERFENQYRIVRPDGTERVIHAWVNVERDAEGRAARLLGTCQDVTERTQVEQHMRDVDQRKNEFLAMLSHELRNPLAPILSAVEVLRLVGNEQTEEAEHCRTVIAQQVEHMKRLLDDLLDISRVSQGKIELRKETCDSAEILRRAIEVSRPLLAKKSQTLEVTGPGETVFVDADPVRLVQVFANLLNNAAKYSNVRGHVAIATSVEGGEAVVRVRDDGIGMTPSMLDRAFDLFVQEASTLDRAQGGLGIGLTMARSLVKMHGGSVRAFSEGPGRGCEMVVRLPRAANASRPAPRPALTVATGTKALRVLVVDDNVDAAQMLGVLLRLLGHDVTLAHDGPSALALAASAPPELVLIDIGLPGMDGYAVGAALRQNGLGGAALVAVTGYGREGDISRSRQAGFDHHLVKPVDLAALQRVTAAAPDR